MLLRKYNTKIQASWWRSSYQRKNVNDNNKVLMEDFFMAHVAAVTIILIWQKKAKDSTGASSTEGVTDHNTIPHSFQTECGSFNNPPKCCKTGPTFHHPYTRRLKSLVTIFRCHYKGSTFPQLIFRPWVLLWSGLWTYDLLHASPLLHQPSQLGGTLIVLCHLTYVAQYALYSIFTN